MCTIRECTNSFAALCYWIRELSNSIKELSNTAIEQDCLTENVGITELFKSIIELSNSCKDIKLN